MSDADGNDREESSRHQKSGVHLASMGLDDLVSV